MSDNPDEMSAEDAAKYLGVSLARVYALANQERIGRKVAGKFYLFTRVELDEYKATRNPKGGRPKSEIALMSPVMAR